MIISVASGKGGTGKTVITAAFAALAGSTVLADCDVDAADLHILLNNEVTECHEFSGGKTAIINKAKCDTCGICIEQCRFDAISNMTFAVDSISCEGCGVCFRICPQGAIKMENRLSGEWFVSNTKYGPLVHAKLGIAEENSGKLVTIVRQKAKLIAEKENREFIIIDGPPGIGCPVIASISGVNAALVVTEPTLSGIHDMSRVLELAKHFKIKAFVVINKYDLNQHMSEEIETYCSKNKIFCAGRIPFDPIVIEALVNRKNVIEYSNRIASDRIRGIWSFIKNEL
jgi:MinD superfamily P-loop ATPase